MRRFSYATVFTERQVHRQYPELIDHHEKMVRESFRARWGIEAQTVVWIEEPEYDYEYEGSTYLIPAQRRLVAEATVDCCEHNVPMTLFCSDCVGFNPVTGTPACDWCGDCDFCRRQGS
jgi:hypothetical protein